MMIAAALFFLIKITIVGRVVEYCKFFHRLTKQLKIIFFERNTISCRKFSRTACYKKVFSVFFQERKKIYLTHLVPAL